MHDTESVVQVIAPLRGYYANRWFCTLGVPFVQGMIEVREDSAPLPEEPENIEFFLEWHLPLECDACTEAQEV